MLGHTYRKKLPVSVWRRGSVTAPHFTRTIARFWTLTSFPGYRCVKEQRRHTPSAPHFFQFNFPFFSLEVWLCLVRNSLLPDSESCSVWLCWNQLIHSGVIALQLLSASLPNETAQIQTAHVFLQVQGTHSQTSYVFLPSGTTPFLSTNYCVVSQLLFVTKWCVLFSWEQ